MVGIIIPPDVHNLIFCGEYYIVICLQKAFMNMEMYAK